MSSIWSNAATSAGSSPFTTNGIAPTPGGGAAARFQSALQSAKNGHAATQLGLSPKAAASAAGSKNAVSGTSGTSSTADTDDAGATITANDFLTLLVTEMQNQDPTADVDPNAYIDQLVQINSLEQLISINQNLSDVLGAASSSGTTSSASGYSPTAAGSGAPQGAGASAINGKIAGKGSTAPSASSSLGSASSGTASKHVTAGNLGIPKPSAASGKVAHALDGHASAVRAGHLIRDIPTRSIAP